MYIEKIECLQLRSSKVIAALLEAPSAHAWNLRVADLVAGENPPMGRGHCDVIQPDIGRLGGLTEAARYAKLAADGGPFRLHGKR